MKKSEEFLVGNLFNKAQVNIEDGFSVYSKIEMDLSVIDNGRNLERVFDCLFQLSSYKIWKQEDRSRKLVMEDLYASLDILRIDEVLTFKEIERVKYYVEKFL